MDSFTAFLIFAALVVLETLAHQFAFPPFFRFGLPVFFARRPSPPAQTADQVTSQLINEIHAGQGYPVLHFPIISPSEIAVQERLFENRTRGRYLPVMHSTLRLDDTRRYVSITGYLNLWVLAAAAYMVYRGLNDRSFIPVGILIFGLLVVSYFIQSGLNRRIVDSASQHDAAV